MPDALSFPPIAELTQLQIDAVDRWHRDPIDNPFDGIQSLVCQQHEFNYRLWHQEDKARSPSATDEEIANVKRAIDKLNQARNDMIEKVDDALTEILCKAGVPASDGPINTETTGSAIDRLSIMSLRLYHYREQADRDGASDEHRGKVNERIALCEQQHADLSKSLQQLVDDIFAGKKQHRTYRQMKMYNDPSLNPAIYNAGS
ncbi:hypothetical protein K227x_16270 [Rubripirellula lacrimiformis]|uniref:DUF4254 domain-containing protein n=1 Tax=Rubripirellula lacrimiformis TaxID=1930273 RepID=A0A517N7X6_9BACT|nr:DUF4254 domain-containing protein [Rubripirellula lacrimiformis]QDT03245.1 hypothetical protein K227x_16270 [Rubripirellula lacrimiformis]